ncbi:unnamed protein product [Nippostrongylus brasiliensis]|uniref:Defective in germ line development protein 3 (inferred by orthology to a C. elegans protein) n=1 Tax=Nippostrongylus brasiliensis TaxID=27835 RepID=A0A0N4Y1Y5_NIPBR|nr:unnamed protein product [Nippostrongylus brasiliensis]
MMAPSTDPANMNRFPSIDLSIRPSLHQILEQPEQFFHISQQSAKMSIDHIRRTRLSNELKRRADIEHYRDRNMQTASLRMVPSLRQNIVDIERVTLTMEVTYSDYEEIFVKRTLRNTDESCANIMRDTNTEIQFPDRDEVNSDFIHQVTITGHLTEVEEARIRLRKFCPVVLMFAVSERLREGIPYKKLDSWIKDRIEDGSINFPTLVIQTLPQQISTSFKEPVIRISGRVADENLLLQACERLRELLFEPEIAEKGLLPMQLCFHAGNEDLRARIDPENRMIKFYDDTLRVSVRVVPSDLESLSALPGDQMRHFISLRSSEYNVGALYAVMRRVLRRGDEIPMVTPTDYAEMLPLISDLCKHSCEVNFRCQLEPRILDLPSMSSVSMSSTSSTSYLLPVNHADQQFSNYGVNDSTDASTLSYRKTSPGVSATRSRNTSPQNAYSSKFALRHMDKENVARGPPLSYSRLKGYNGERRNNTYRSYRYGATNSTQSKHHLALRNRDVEADVESCSRVVSDELYLRRRNGQMLSGCERFHHGVFERRNGTEWRDNQVKSAETTASHSHVAKTMLSQRPKTDKIELQRRTKENHIPEDQENVHRLSNKRMDVMDLIKLASGEDSERRLCLAEENECILDSGDASDSNPICGIDAPAASDTYQELVQSFSQLLIDSSSAISVETQRLVFLPNKERC